MKLYTTPEQTAKLIELGFEKPIASHSYWRGNELVININYSIGELIELLPEVACRSNADDDHHHLTIYNDAMYWNVAYRNDYDDLCYVAADELVDALYDMVVKFKEEGVI